MITLKHLSLQWCNLTMLLPPVRSTRVLQPGGSPAAEDAGAEQAAGDRRLAAGSEDVAVEEPQASQEDGSGGQDAAQQQPPSNGADTHNDVWVDAAESEVPPWALRQQPAALAQPGSLLAGREQLSALPGTPRHLVFAIRAAVEQRGDAVTRVIPPDTLLPPDQNNTQCMGWVLGRP